MPWMICASLLLLCGVFALALLEGYLAGKRLAAEAVEGRESLR